MAQLPALKKHLVPSGLCGNYNMIMSDDMTTPQGIVEGTAATFCNSWKTNQACRDRKERLDDPCSLSVENGKTDPVAAIVGKLPTWCVTYFH